MTQKEFLKSIGLTREEFSDLLQKYAAFEKQLNPAQLAAVMRSMPTRSQALRSLGGELTAEQLNKLVKKLHLDADDPAGNDGGGFGQNILKAKVGGTQ
jgi:hypothetical protein